MAAGGTTRGEGIPLAGTMVKAKVSGPLLVACIAFGIAASGASRIGYVPEGDSHLYAEVAHRVRSGVGYYQASTDVLSSPNPPWPSGPPSSPLQYRTPFQAYVLAATPDVAWWALDTLAWIMALLAVARLSRRPTIGVILAGAWTVAASRWGFATYHEVWGLPFVMWGWVRARGGDWRGAGILLAVASIIRELYAPLILLGVLFHPASRRYLLRAGVVVAAVYAVHLAVLWPYLSTPELVGVNYGGLPNTFMVMAGLVSPAYGMVPTIVGLTVWAAAVPGMWREKWIGVYVVGAGVATMTASRYYWSVCWMMMLCVMANSLRERRRPMAAAPGPDTASTPDSPGRVAQLDPA